MLTELLTCSGKYFNFMEPENSSVDIEDIAHALSNICRFGGHTRSFYSVAQHCVMVSEIVSESVQLQALLHDASEAFVGDVIKPLKDQMPNYELIEAKVQSAIYRHFGLSEMMSPEIKKADRILLATERRDLMSENLIPWSLTQGIEPLKKCIQPLSPIAAKQQYLDRFAFLIQKMKAAA